MIKITLESVLSHSRAFGESVFAYSKKIKFENPPFERIVFLGGINSNVYSLKSFKKDLKLFFPNTEIIFMDRNYDYTKIDLVNDIISNITQELEENKKTIVIGYSFGGMLAKACINKLKNRDHVCCLVTIATPHKMDEFGIDEAKKHFDIPDNISELTAITFGGYFDVVVPEKYTHMDEEDVHFSLKCTHLAFVHLPSIRKELIIDFMIFLKYFDN